MTYDKEARTAFASKALELSDLFMIKFGRTRFAGSPPRVVKVQEPNTESTGGGKQAREPIALVPEGSEGAGGLVCGWMDVAENRAEMRSFPVLAEMHRRRYQMALELSQQEYDAFLAEARRFFSEEGMPMHVTDDVPELEAPARAALESPTRASPTRARPSRDGGMSPGLVAALAGGAVVLGLVLGYVLFAPG